MADDTKGAEVAHDWIRRDVVPPITAAVTMAVLRGERTVRDVAAAVGCTVETAHRHLRAARALGLVGWETGKAGTLHTRLRVVGGAS